MAFTMPQQMNKNSANLSKLAKGVGEFYDEEKRIEIVLDEHDKIKKKFSKFMTNVQPTTAKPDLNSKQEINLPKTYTTRKGALILFSDELFSSATFNNEKPETIASKDLAEESSLRSKQAGNQDFKEAPIKTVNDLQRNVLYYGITPKDRVPYLKNETHTNMKNLTSNSLTSFEENNNNNNANANNNAISGINENTMFSLVNISTKNLLTGKTNLDVQNSTNSVDDLKLQRINRGLSAKRYLNNLTKHWDQNVLETFISDGKIKPSDATNLPTNERKSSKRKHVDDDLTVWPQAYRFDPNWSTAAVDMRSYRFVKAQDFNLTKDDSRVENSFKNSSFEDLLDKPKKKKSAKAEPIKIIDPQREAEISYKSLATEEKEKVLSELLFHSALSNIKQQQINEFNDSSISYSVEKNRTANKSKTQFLDDQNKQQQQLQQTPINGQLSPKLNQKSLNFELEEKSVEKTDAKRTSHKVGKSDSKPVYMFNKLPGAPWVSKKIPKLTSEELKQSETLLQSRLTQASSKKSVITPILHTEIGTAQPTRNIPIDPSRSKTYLNRILNASSTSLKKETSLKLNSNENFLTASPSQSQSLSKDKTILSEFAQLSSQPINEIDATEIQYENFVQTNLLDINNQKEDNLALDLNDLDKPKDDQVIDSIGHNIEGDEITPIEMYLEEMRSVEDDFALDDSMVFNMKEVAESSRSLDPDLLNRKDDLAAEIKKKLIKNDIKIDESLEEAQDEPKPSPEMQKNFKTFQNVQTIQTEKLQQSDQAQETNVEDSKRVSTLDRRLKRFTRPINSRKFDSNQAEQAELKDKRLEKLSKFSKYESISATNTNKTVVISETTKISPKKISSSPTFNQSNTQPTHFSIPGIQLAKDSNDPATSTKLSLYDDKDDLTSEISYRNNNLPMAPIKANDIEENQILLRSINKPKNDDYNVVSKEKLPLPKLNFNQENSANSITTNAAKQAENIIFFDRKLPDEKKFKLVYLDDDYAKVETIKLKPKTNTTTPPTFLRRSAFENTSMSYSSFAKRPETFDIKEEKSIFWKDWGNPKDLSFPTENNIRYKSMLAAPKEEEDTQKAIKPSKANLSSLKKKKDIDWSVGDFDPRECFCLWSYETPPPPIVVDRDFAAALKRYAQLLARVILGKKTGGLNLSEDIKRALKANIEKLIQALTHGKMSRELLDEYKKIFKNVLAKLLKRKDLDNLEISDEMLMKLLELPPEAFEIFLDPVTLQETLRIRSAYLREQAKLIRNVITEKELTLKDFDSYIDPVTGEVKYKIKNDVAKKLGIPDGAEDMFEVAFDENGNPVIRLKDGAKTLTIGDTTYEMVIDPSTGKQVLKMVTKQKVGKETIEDILRLAANMTPETKNRYFQELLKTAGATMSDELRQKIIGEMFKNVEDLPEEVRENLLKELMTNLVNQLPSDLAQKMLADIMKATDNIDSSIKEKMMQNLIKDLDQLPDELRDQALKEIMSNLDSLSSEQKQKLLEDILSKVEELGVTSKETDQIKNKVLKEMLINAQNFDEETRNKIIQQVLAKATADGNDVPQTILEELVKQMNTLPAEFKDLVMSEIKKSLESGNLDKNVLAELLKNSDELTPEILSAIVKNAEKMESSTLQELIKNLDKLPDELKIQVLNKMVDKMDSEALQELMKNIDKIPEDMKMEIINKMFDKMDTSTMKELVKNLDKLSDEMKTEIINKMLNNMENLSSEVQQQLLKELLTNPNLIQDETLREKVIRDILKNMSVDDVLKDTANMTAEEKHKYYQDLLSRAGDLNEETRQKLIELMLKNAENLDEETRENLLNDFVKNIVKDLPPDVQAKVLADLMKNTEHLDTSLKQKMIDNLLKNLDELPPELKQQALGEIVKNLDDLPPEKKQEIFKTILNRVDDLPPELRDKTLKVLVENMDNFSSDVKNKLLQNILDKVEQAEGDSDFKKSLRNEVIKEIIKNSQNLDEESRKKILSDVMTKLGTEDVPNVILQELIKQMDSLPNSIKDQVMGEIKKNIDKGNIDAKVLGEMLKNAKNIPKDILEKLVTNAKNLPPEALAELVKNLDTLPDHLKEKALKDMLSNINNLDPVVKKELLNELLKNPQFAKDRQAFESAILGLLENIESVPENVRRDMLKNVAKNIKSLSDETKAQVLKEVFSNLQTSSDETREDVIKQLLKKMGQKELEEWIKNSDLSEEVKQKMLKDIKNILGNDDALWDSDDEETLKNLSPEERERRKRQIIERRRIGEADNDDKLKDILSKMDKEQKHDLQWVKAKQKKVLKNLKLNPNEPVPDLTDDQMEFIKSIYKLKEEDRDAFLKGLNDEERKAFYNLQNVYEKIRQQELTNTLLEAKNLAIAKLRERLALQKRIEYLNLLRIEANMFQHAQQLTRAFVFSYYDLLQWLDVSPDLPVLA